MRRRERQRAGLPVRAEINVTSLVDVAFTLLVIFIITAPVMQGGIEVNVPRGPVKVIEASDDHIILTVERDNTITIGESPVAEEMLDATLAELIEARNADVVFVKGDSAALYGRVARAIAAVAANEGVRLSLVMREFRR